MAILAAFVYAVRAEEPRSAQPSNDGPHTIQIAPAGMEPVEHEVYRGKGIRITRTRKDSTPRTPARAIPQTSPVEPPADTAVAVTPTAVDSGWRGRDAARPARETVQFSVSTASAINVVSSPVPRAPANPRIRGMFVDLDATDAEPRLPIRPTAASAAMADTARAPRAATAVTKPTDVSGRQRDLTFLRLLGEQPWNPAIRHAYVDTLVARGDYATAIPHLEHLLALAPSDTAARHKLDDCRRHLGLWRRPVTAASATRVSYSEAEDAFDPPTSVRKPRTNGRNASLSGAAAMEFNR